MSSAHGPVVLLVTGGRSFGYWDEPGITQQEQAKRLAEHEWVWAQLDRARSKREIQRIVTGGATGADRAAEEWARSRSVPFRVYPVGPARWRERGAGAGPQRNAQMLLAEHPDVVVAFPGGVGTADMVERAKREGITVWEPGSGRRSVEVAHA